ncbi:phage tail protein [Thermophilibacter provencensis]|uniref:Phage minor structural protein, N-terminal region n=1 Tax=Thermophilibacter provencensis TaxID=1852386 RepID=A0ABT7V237_9ACTN|nr:phage tail protein [Thermophilibacter provencensis]MDM8270536.1 hypothetical protein [Thermophilibacter provencensis]
MYRVYLGGALAFDALEDDSVVVSASISQAVNAAAYLDMELSPAARPEAGQSAEVLWDGTRLFHGRVTEVEQRADGTWAASAVSDLDRLNDVLVPPHSTDGETGSECPGTLSGYVRWLAETFNARQGGGFRVDVGTNQADLLREGALSLEDDSWPTVAAALEDHVLALGGYVDWEPHATSGTLSVWSDLHEASSQLVDLGANVTDISVTRSVEGRATAIVPHSGSGEDEVTLAGLTAAERQLVSNAGMSLTAGGDGIMDPASVSEWGYREERVEIGGVSTRADLVRAAIARLRTMAGPQVTVECRAVDMALYREDMAHLRVGQAVRVRAEPLGVDEYLAVQEMSLDLMDPAQTTYVLGVTYDTLTGRQSAFLRGLNGSINHALDVVTGVEDTINHVVNDADTDYYLSDSPDEPVGGEWGSANVVPIDNKYLFSRPHNTLVDGSEVIGEPTLLTPSVQRSLKLHRDVGDEPVWVAFVAANSDVTDPDAQGMCRITGQMGGWDASEQGAVTVAFGFQDSAYATGEGSAGVGVVTEKSADIDTSKVSIQAYESQGRVGVYVMLTGKVTVSLYAEGDGFSTPFVEQSTQPSGTKVFDLADVQTTYESAILQADNAIRAYVAATYATQGALGEVQSTFDIRANQIQAQVEEKMDTAVAETRFTEKSTFNQFSDSISAEVEQVRDTADATATKAAQLEVSLEGVTTTVSEAVETAEGAMAKATEVEQTADSISSTVTGLDGRVSKVEQDASGFEVTLGQVRGTANSALSAANSAKTTANTANSTANKANADVLNYVIDGAPTGSGSLSGWTVTGGVYQRTFPGGENHKDFSSQSARRAWGVGARLRFTADFRVASGTFSSSDFFNIYEGGGDWVSAKIYPYQAAGGGWVTLSALFSGPLTTQTSSYGFSSYVGSSGSKVLQMRNVRIEEASDATTATNYLKFDSSGLVVGNFSGTLQGNVLLNSSGMQVRNGTSIYATYGANLIELGRNNSSSKIRICGGGVDLSYNTTNKGLSISKSTTVSGSVFCTQLSTSGVLNVGGTMWLGVGQRTQIRGFYQGTKVVNVDTTSTKHVLLFNNSQYTSIVGREYKVGDVILVSNGDYNAKPRHAYGTTYRGDTKNWYVCVESGQTGSMRINYLIVAVA